MTDGYIGQRRENSFLKQKSKFLSLEEWVSQSCMAGDTRELFITGYLSGLKGTLHTLSTKLWYALKFTDLYPVPKVAQLS